MLKTAGKIVLARFLSKIIVVSRRLAGYGPAVQVRRHGINWLLDLQEGIDLSIYLLGAFERGRSERIPRSLGKTTLC